MENLLRICLQLGDVAFHLPLTGRELSCELINTLAYRCDTQRKLFQIV